MFTPSFEFPFLLIELQGFHLQILRVFPEAFLRLRDGLKLGFAALLLADREGGGFTCIIIVNIYIYNILIMINL